MEERIVKTNEAVIATLNSLIETCKDGENGFRTAADSVTNNQLRTLFNTYARQRAQFAAELQAEVRRVGGDPERTGSSAAAMHRGWINLKAAVTGGDEGAIIAECERGEDSAVKNYHEAQQAGLPRDVQAIVERQYMHVQAAHDRIRDLEKAIS